MTSERWQQVKALFEATVEQPVAERAAYLECASGDDRALRDEVESLLISEDLPNGFLDRLPVVTEVARADVVPDRITPLRPEPSPAVLAAGARIGSYDIVATLGCGAMGHVYRAHDEALNRFVALKVLPDLFARDSERLARFSREARLLAALNHPNIAGIFGFQESHGVVTLAMELVEGETLAARIAAGPMPLRETLTVARQIAGALEAVHEKGIIHRDLKPANIMISRDGVVKVLDFGLAKACDTADVTLRARSPGLTAADGLSTIMGTPAYMSPEQARGQSLDRRTDIWSFGCVLYEMLAARPPFAGDTISDTLATILDREPDFGRLPSATPPAIHRLLRRCLEKRRDKRLDSAAVAQLEIDDALESAGTIASALGVAPVRRPRAATIAAVSGAVVLTVAAGYMFGSQGPGASVIPSRFAIVPPSEPTLNISGSPRDIVLSPDGRTLVYRAGGSQTDGSPLMAREINRLDARPIANIAAAYAPFFSPDSRWLGFFERGLLKKVDIAGGPIVTLCETAGAPLGATWSDDNVITFATGPPNGGLWRVPADGGEPTLVTRPDHAREGDDYAFPSALPRGSGLLVTVRTAGSSGGSQVAVLDYKTGRPRTLIRGGSDAQYIESGYLIFATERSLRAVRFDPARLELLGEPVTVVEDVLVKPTGAADYTLSHGGTLVYMPAELARLPLRALVWVDRRGHEEPVKAPLQVYGPGRVSPDGKRVALGILENGSADIWIMDLPGGALKRLTNARGANGMPVWTPDGRAVIFSMSNEAGILNLYRLRVDGAAAPEPVTSSRTPSWPTSVMPDGSVVAFKRTGIIVVPARASAEERDGLSLFAGNFAEVSPDGRYLAYQSGESGQSEVYVRPFPDVRSGPWRVSTAGGSRPAWARSGRELFFLDGSNAMMAVQVQTSGPTFSAGTPSRLFEGKYLEPNPARHYDVSPDGKRFLMIRNGKEADDKVTPASMVVVLNWTEEMKRRVPAR